MITSQIPLFFLFNIGFLSYGKYDIYIYCHYNFIDNTSFTFGGYYQDQDDKCFDINVDKTDCSTKYGCASIGQTILDYTWYGSEAKLCRGINLNKAYLAIDNTTINMYTNVNVSCHNDYGYKLNVFQTIKHFSIYDTYLPYIYYESLKTSLNSETFQLSRDWHHADYISLPLLSIYRTLKRVKYNVSPFLSMEIGNLQFSYVCGSMEAGFDLYLSKPSCGSLIPINFTHAICSDLLFRSDVLRCFDDYKIYKLPIEYVKHKFIKETPSGFFGTIIEEIFHGLFSFIQPIIEEIIKAIIYVLSDFITLLINIIDDIMPLIFDLLDKIFDTLIKLANIIVKLIYKFINLLFEIFKIIDRDFILTELIISYILGGVWLGPSRALFLCIIFAYLFSFHRTNFDFRYIIY